MRRPDVRQRVIEAVLDLAAAAGVDDVHLIAALALHRRMTEAELRHAVGDRVYDAFAPHGLLYNHDAEDPDGIAFIGETSQGEEVEINKRAAESDLHRLREHQPRVDGRRLEVHRHRSGLLPLAAPPPQRADDAAVAELHGPPQERAPQLELAHGRGAPQQRREGVPDRDHAEQQHASARPGPMSVLQKREWEWTARDRATFIGMKAGLDRMPMKARRKIFNSWLAPYGITSVQAGEVEAVHEVTTQNVFAQQLVPIEGQADVLTMGLPYICPYNVNSVMNPILVMCLGLGYFFNMYRGQPLVREGGVVIMSHPTPWEFHPVHHPSYIDFFEQVLAETTDPVEIEARFEKQYAEDEWYRHLYRTSYAYHGVHPFYMWYWGCHGMAHVGKVIIVGGEPRSVRRLGFTPASTLQDALEMATDVVGRHPTITHLHNPPIVMADVTCDGEAPAEPAARPAPRLPVHGTDGARHRRRAPARRRASAPTTRRTGRAGSPPGSPASCCSKRSCDRPSPRSARPSAPGIDRLAGLTDGPVIFAPNHHSHLDTPTMLTSIPEPWRYKVFVAAAADYFFKTHVTSAASALALGAIPMDRSKVSRRTADQAADLIEQGWSMLIFPEGGRSPDGWGQPFRGGAAYLSNRCDVPVVPVHLEGTGKILRKGAKRPTPSHVRVTFGTPLAPRRRREHQPLRRAHRAGRRRAGRRGDHRLVAVAAPRRRRHHPAAHRPGRPGLAAGVGARRPVPQAPPPDPRLAEALVQLVASARRRRSAPGELHDHGDAAVDPVLEADLAAVVRDDLGAGGQADAAAGVLVVGVEAGEHAEHLVALRRLHPDAVVGRPGSWCRTASRAPEISMRGVTSARTNLSELPTRFCSTCPSSDRWPQAVGQRLVVHLGAGARDGRGEVGEHLREELVEVDLLGGGADRPTALKASRSSISCRMRLAPRRATSTSRPASPSGGGRRQRHLDAGERRLQVVGGGVGEPLELLVRAFELVVAMLELAAGVEERGRIVGSRDSAVRNASPASRRSACTPRRRTSTFSWVDTTDDEPPVARVGRQRHVQHRPDAVVAAGRPARRGVRRASSSTSSMRRRRPVAERRRATTGSPLAVSTRILRPLTGDGVEPLDDPGPACAGHRAGSGHGSRPSSGPAPRCARSMTSSGRRRRRRRAAGR